MEFIDGAVPQRADDIFTNDSGGGLGGRSGRDHRRGSGSSVGGYLACSIVPIKPVLMCRWRHLEWVAGSWSLCTLSVRGAHVHGLQCFLGVSCAPAHAAHASPRTSGAGSNVSRTRTRDVRGMCERCAGLHDGTTFWASERSALYVSMSFAARVLNLA